MAKKEELSHVEELLAGQSTFVIVLKDVSDARN